MQIRFELQSCAPIGSLLFFAGKTFSVAGIEIPGPLKERALDRLGLYFKSLERKSSQSDLIFRPFGSIT